MTSPSVSSRSEEAASVFIFITIRTQAARLWSRDPPATLTAVCVAHSLGTRFCSKCTSVSDTCTAPHSATFYDTWDNRRGERSARWLLAMLVVEGLRAEVLDVLSAFLHGHKTGSVSGLTGTSTAFGRGVVELAAKELSLKGSWLRIFMIL